MFIIQFSNIISNIGEGQAFSPFDDYDKIES